MSDWQGPTSGRSVAPYPIKENFSAPDTDFPHGPVRREPSPSPSRPQPLKAPPWGLDSGWWLILGRRVALSYIGLPRWGGRNCSLQCPVRTVTIEKPAISFEDVSGRGLSNAQWFYSSISPKQLGKRCLPRVQALLCPCSQIIDIRSVLSNMVDLANSQRGAV